MSATAERRRTVRHTAKTMLLAQELAGSGWTANEIVRLDLLGVPVTYDTVRKWIDPEYADRRRRATRTRIANKRTNGRSLGNVLMHPVTRWRRMRALRDEAGLTYDAVARVMRLDFGVDLSAEQVRYALQNDVMPAGLSARQRTELANRLGEGT